MATPEVVDAAVLLRMARLPSTLEAKHAPTEGKSSQLHSSDEQQTDVNRKALVDCQVVDAVRDS